LVFQRGNIFVAQNVDLGYNLIKFQSMIPTTFGRYEIKAEIGRGGMATVYRAYDPRFERDVAIKVLPHELLHDPAFKARFEREAKIIAALEHPAIVPVHDFGEENGQPYLVMRYMPGGSLEERIRKAPLPLSEVTRIFNRLAPAVDEAHIRGVIHRDLKPANILFDQYDEPYLSDFGIAKLAEATVTLTGGGVVGSPAYMSPEQARGEPDIDGRTDIYSLGAILFQMLSGRTPYESTTPTGQLIRHVTDPVPDILKVRPDLPAGCQTVIATAMAKQKTDRYTAARLMAQDISSIQPGTVASTVPATVVEVQPSAVKTVVDSAPPAAAVPEHPPAIAIPHQRSVIVLQQTRRGFPAWLALLLGAGAVGLILMIIVIGFAVKKFRPVATLTPTSTVVAVVIPTTAMPTVTVTQTPLPTRTLTPTTLPSVTSTVTPEPTLLPMAIVAVDAANVRSGPSTAFAIVETLPLGEELTVTGRSQDGSWLTVLLDDGKEGWISLSVVTVDFDVQSLAEIESPPTPQVSVASLTPTPKNKPPTSKPPTKNPTATPYP
jgi:eukaryotic-like serine/threonine-protein kinase